MSRVDLDALVARRDELQAEHEAAVALLEAEGPDHAIGNHRACCRLHDDLTDVQRRIDALLETERSR